MYALANLHFPRPVDTTRLIAALAPATPLPVAIAQTVFASDPANAANGFYAQPNRMAVYLLLKHGDQSLELHLECVLARGSVAELKRQLEHVLQSVIDAGVQSSQKPDTIGIAIYAEESNRITEGRFEPFGEIMLRRFRETIIGDVLLAVVPAAVGLVYGVMDLKLALVAVGSAALAGLIWFSIEAVKRRKVIVYEDV
jgi:hypothetical protein